MPEGEIFVERRRFKRVEKRLQVSYKIVSLPDEISEIKKQAGKKTVDSANISCGGIQLIDEEKLEPEYILRLEFAAADEKKIITFAEIKWTAKDENEGKYRTGIEFLVLKEEDKQAIESLIEKD